MTTAMMATGLMAVQGGKVTDADLKKFAISASGAPTHGRRVA